MGFTYTDPYDPDRGYFECTNCGNRTTAQDRLEHCPTCGGTVTNIAVPRD